MHITIKANKTNLGKVAASTGADLIRTAIARRGKANVIFATGTSQFELLEALVQEKLDWPVITAFHLDEYIGLSINHPASFRKYLKERLVDKIPLKTFHYINAELDAQKECDRLAALISQQPIDVAFIGIGENGHLAFNDPPADFVTETPYIIVNLDEACRKQQLGEGWFNTLEEVPNQAISMSIQQILKAKHIICTVPDLRKAKAVQAAVEGAIGPLLPASILRKHKNTQLFLDQNSASLLT